MFSNLSASLTESNIAYPIGEQGLPFQAYVEKCRTFIEERRTDLQQYPNLAQEIIDYNCPFELVPNNPIYQNNRKKYGALLIHGLFDSPFSLRDVALRLQTNGIFNRSILLPGHGTQPSDLLTVSYHQWIQAVRYGVESLKQEVEQIFLIGYSTGATLSLYQALQDKSIAGVILLSPAIKIKAPVDIMVAWHYFMRCVGRSTNKNWLYLEKETDYVKYHSIPFNAVKQVSQLTEVIQDLHHHHPLETPVLLIVSREDETISSHRAIDFFTSVHNEKNKLLLYTSYEHLYPDKRILTRTSIYPELHINHFSHASIPFAPNNPHYGQTGDYICASRLNKNNYIFGAYNRVEINFFSFLKQLGIVRSQRLDLTYNPDFDYMADTIVNFICNN